MFDDATEIIGGTRRSSSPIRTWLLVDITGKTAG